jgi:hypothetical protein
MTTAEARYRDLQFEYEQLRIFADEMKKAVGHEHHKAEEQFRINVALQIAIGKERDQVERLRKALTVLNARFHSVCNGIGPHVHALYLEDLAEVRAILGEPRDEDKP